MHMAIRFPFAPLPPSQTPPDTASTAPPLHSSPPSASPSTPLSSIHASPTLSATLSPSPLASPTFSQSDISSHLPYPAHPLIALLDVAPPSQSAMERIISGATGPIDHIPDEIFKHLLQFVSPQDNLGSVQLVSRRFNQLANDSLLWKQHCNSTFTYWLPEHRFHERVKGLASETEWKKLFILRFSRNKRIARMLDDIIATKVGRVKRFELIGQLGYDAKDLLLEQCQISSSVDDHLARRQVPF